MSLKNKSITKGRVTGLLCGEDHDTGQETTENKAFWHEFKMCTRLRAEITGQCTM